MKKKFEFNCLGNKLVVVFSMKEIYSTSSINLENGEFQILKMQGFLYSSEGRLIRTGDLKEYLPATTLGNTLKALWQYNNAFIWGTQKQYELLGITSTQSLIGKGDFILRAISELKEANLYEDRGFVFGERVLINPLSDEILLLANNLLSA